MKPIKNRNSLGIVIIIVVIIIGIIYFATRAGSNSTSLPLYQTSTGDLLSSPPFGSGHAYIDYSPYWATSFPNIRSIQVNWGDGTISTYTNNSYVKQQYGSYFNFTHVYNCNGLKFPNPPVIISLSISVTFTNNTVQTIYMAPNRINYVSTVGGVGVIPLSPDIC